MNQLCLPGMAQKPARCACCSRLSRLDQGICGACERRYGRRGARLLSRCLADPGFRSSCLSQLSHEARQHLASLLGERHLRGGPGLLRCASAREGSGAASPLRRRVS